MLFRSEALGANLKLDFKITAVNGVTTNSAPPFTTSAKEVTLTGVAPYGVLHVFPEPRPTHRAEWITDTTWKLSSVPLTVGENTFKIVGVDQMGRTVKDLSVTVVRSVPQAGGR